MRILLSIVGYVIASALLCVPALPQSNAGRMNHFSKDGLSFDYPAGWILTDQSTTQVQKLTLTKKGDPVQVTVIARRELTYRNQMESARRQFTEPLVVEMALKLKAAGKTAERETARIDVGGVEAEGFRLHGKLKKKNATAEVYTLRRGLRFINLAYLGTESEEVSGEQGWKLVRSSLKVNAPVIGASAKSQTESPAASDDNRAGVLNGNAIALPQPAYPAIAKAARSVGTVAVQVLIDEEGSVIAANAVSGPPLLRAASVAAARAAKFSPTFLDGEPVKVAGIINYNFKLN
jgi:TonB family protein